MTMRRDEIGTRNAIAVEEDAVVAAAAEDRAVADFGRPKASIDLPNVAERNTEPRLPAFHQARGRGTRAIIRDDDLEAAVALARQRRQRCIERILAIVGRDDDGDEVRHLGTAPVFHPACVLQLLPRCDSLRHGQALYRGNMQKVSAYILAYNEAEKI